MNWRAAPFMDVKKSPLWWGQCNAVKCYKSFLSPCPKIIRQNKKRFNFLFLLLFQVQESTLFALSELQLVSKEPKTFTVKRTLWEKKTIFGKTNKQFWVIEVQTRFSFDQDHSCEFKCHEDKKNLWRREVKLFILIFTHQDSCW